MLLKGVEILADLSVSYMGITLKNPVITGASGLTTNLDTQVNQVYKDAHADQ